MLLFFLDGKYKICFYNAGIKWPDPIQKRIKFEFRVKVDDETIIYENIAKRKEFFGLLNFMDELKEKIRLNLEKNEVYRSKAKDLFRVESFFKILYNF